MLANSSVVRAHYDCMEGAVMVREGCYSVHILIRRLDQVWVKMIGLASASTEQYPTKREPFRFGLCWNADQFVSGSSTCWLYQRCCDGLGVLSGCSNSYNKPLPSLVKNGHPRFHLNWLLYMPLERTSTTWLVLKCWQIREWFEHIMILRKAICWQIREWFEHIMILRKAMWWSEKVSIVFTYL